MDIHYHFRFEVVVRSHSLQSPTACRMMEFVSLPSHAFYGSGYR